MLRTSYTDLLGVATREFQAQSPDKGGFPVQSFYKFLNAAYRFGLLTIHRISPNGDVYSRERIEMYEISPNARELLAEYTPIGFQMKTETLPAVPQVDTSAVRERLASVIEYLTKNGPGMQDVMLDDLTKSVADDEIDEQLDRLQESIEEGVQLGILSRKEGALGALVVSIGKS